MPPETIIQEELLPEQILQAAMQLYQKHGIKKVTMDDVSKAIGKSRSSLYYYYKNRDEIFDAVMEALVQEVISEISQAVAEEKNIENKIRAFCFAKIKTSEERKFIFSAMETGMDADEISKHREAMTALHKRLVKLETAVVKKFLSASAKQNEIRVLSSKEQETFIFILLSSVRGIKREIAHENNISKINSAINTLTNILIHWLRD